MLIGLGVLILLLALGGSYLLGTNNALKSSPLSKISPTIQPSPTTDPTADWKEYIIEGLRFKYPPAFSLNKTISKDPNKVTQIELENGDVRIGIWDTLLGGDIVPFQSKQIVLDGRDASRQSFSRDRSPNQAFNIDVLIPNGKKQFTASINAVSDKVDRPLTQSEINMFDQILSTFKFTDSSHESDISTWKSYSNKVASFTLRYPSNWMLTERDGQVTIKSSTTSLENQEPTQGAEFYIEIISSNTPYTLEKLLSITQSTDTLRITQTKQTTVDSKPAIEYNAADTPQAIVNGVNIGLNNGFLRILMKNYGKTIEDQMILNNIRSSLKFTQ